MTSVRKSPWLNDRATLLVALLRDRHGLTVSEDVARHDISDHLDYVAEIMRIGRHAAKMYVTDDVIGDMADRIATAVRQHPVSQHPPLPAHQPRLVYLDTERRRRRDHL